MRRKRLWLRLLCLLGTVTLVIFEGHTFVLRGYLRGEAFHRGRPTSYWARELERSWHLRFDLALREGILSECIYGPAYPFWRIWLMHNARGLSRYLPRHFPDYTDAKWTDFNDEAVPVLTELLADDRPQVRRMAAVFLARCGPWAQPAVPALLELLKNEDATIRAFARMALGNIDPAAAARAAIQ